MVKKSKGIKTLLSVLIITALVISMQIVGYGISTTVYLSDVQWERASIGWGNIHINRSVGNNPITLNGVKYPKGIGTHANSDITYNLGGVCATFDADVGVDDEMTGYSTVVFQVFLDGVIAYDSGTMNPGTATRSISLNVTGVQKLRLIVTDAGDGNNSDHVDWANARVSVNSGYTFPVLPPADIGDVNNPKGDYYDYTLNWYPERPYIRDYTQMPITKIYLARKDPSNPSNATIVYMTFEQALDAIIKLDKLMNGAPKIVYLVGWQYQGHDSKYPAWAQVNSALKRAADATALDSLKWLMNEAFKYNTVVSLHINMIDSFQDSPLWSTYNSNNIVAKETDGTLIPGETFDGQVSYQNDYKKEWDMGYAKQRIDGLLSMLPIQTAGTIHIDAFHSAAPSHWDRPISPLNGYTLTEQQYTQRRIMRYWRQQGVDVTAEYTSMSTLKPDPFYGLQAGSWHSGIGAEIPSYLSVDTPLEPIEDQIKYNDWNGVRSTVFTRFVPWYYRNNTSKEIGFESHEDGNGNYFYPALWKDQAIIAYSTNGYTSKTWTMPPGWSTVTQADLYTVSANGNTYVSSVSISNNQITFSMSAGQALLIVPSNSTVRPSQVQVNLSSYFNQDGFSYDTNRADGAFGEDNFATYSADLVATNPTYDGTTYSFGPMANGSMNEIKGAGQVINLTQGQYTSIRMLGAATGGDQTGTFTVTYTDNSTSVHSVTMEDWCKGTPAGIIQQTMAHRHLKSGSDETINTRIYAYYITPTPGKRVKSITMPNNASMHVIAITMLTPMAVKANLSSYFNQDGFSYDTNRADGAFGEDNYATYSADLVAANPTYDGTTYSFGPMTNGSTNEIKATGQIINLTQGQYTSIRMLGAATGGDQTGTFTVTYTDNSTSVHSVTMEDWCKGAPTGMVEQTMVHRHLKSGSDETINTRIYAYYITPTVLKTVKSITMPNNASMHVVAINMLN